LVSQGGVSILSPQQRGLQSQFYNYFPAATCVSILSPQQRGLQYEMPLEGISVDEVSILSPQQRGLQFPLVSILLTLEMFQFSAPNKGDCNSQLNFSTKCWKCFNSQPPTKGTAIQNGHEVLMARTVSILSPQQRGLQF